MWCVRLQTVKRSVRNNIYLSIVCRLNIPCTIPEVEDDIDDSLVLAHVYGGLGRRNGVWLRSEFGGGGTADVFP